MAPPLLLLALCALLAELFRSAALGLVIKDSLFFDCLPDPAPKDFKAFVLVDFLAVRDCNTFDLPTIVR
jgi:hypothetical protein